MKIGLLDYGLSCVDECGEGRSAGEEEEKED